MAISSLIIGIKYLPTIFSNKILLIRKHVHVGKDVLIRGKIFITGHGTVTFDDGVRINSCLEANPIGGDNKTIINTCVHGHVHIGSNTGISNSSLVARDHISIGKNVKIGGGTQIFDNDFHSLNISNRMLENDNDIGCSPIIIKDGVFIGARCIILKGVIIGTNSVIGAGSVVTKSIPDNEIWAGNPAKFIRKCN